MAIVSCILAIFAVALTTPSDSLHLEGVWNSEEEFFKFLTRFGFQQTFDDDKSNTEGYIYGNITLLDPQNDTRPTSEFVVVDSEYFLDYYGNKDGESGVCPAMFRKIDTKAWDPICNPGGKEDFLRPLPCPVGLPCINGTQADWLIPGYQFTYKVDDILKPRYELIFWLRSWLE
ncbi:hypothetical protein NP493_437g05034 [Ridgeia piscesae]|uniref:Uncharacterized protein n=1 Tax=Ridgeia piscesae TaxID=27915 RepID=A0AAD9NSB4_RIDPI|nr:hypothetical protein NP493_437g05034 [Ridgeia piscesae]